MAQNTTEHVDNTNEAENADIRDIEKRENNMPPLRRNVLTALVQDFGPFWFTWCMNSGVLAILTHQCPYQFPGLKVISTIFFVFDLTLFVLFSAAFTARFVIFGSQAYGEITGELSDLMLCACWPIAFMTLTSLTSLIASNAYWGRHALTIVAYVMWWVVCFWALAVLFWVFGDLIAKHEISVQAGEGVRGKRLPMMVIIPAVSVSTVAITGALVASHSYDISARMAVPVIIVSFLMVGVGILLGFMLTTYLFHGLLSQGWPPPPQTASVFILVGPMGQSAAALQQLGQAARVYRKFVGYDKGTFLTGEAAVPLEAACMLIALLLTGLGIIWTFLGVYAMVSRALQKQLKWTPSWNAIIFPVGTLTTSTTLLATEMDSPAWRVVTAGLIIILLFFFLLNSVFTLKGIWKGELLVVREDPRVKRKMQEDHKVR
ncbi:hypothetical protein LTR64_000931 [Lithohypha guttulata]|uniref:uncharacterized protein n=1 Tax=Lithohypha guttulata TaxID=1690604 RepID=UPI002DE1AFB0|nr:hypothetical protein LTR51_003125 [Lithohypha guttulata]